MVEYGRIGEKSETYGGKGYGEGGIVGDLGDVFVYLEDFLDAGD